MHFSPFSRKCNSSGYFFKGWLRSHQLREFQCSIGNIFSNPFIFINTRDINIFLRGLRHKSTCNRHYPSFFHFFPLVSILTQWLMAKVPQKKQYYLKLYEIKNFKKNIYRLRVEFPVTCPIITTLFKNILKSYTSLKKG